MAGKQGIKGVLLFLNDTQALWDDLGNGLSLSNEINIASEIGTGLKWFGRASAGFGAGYSYYQYTNNQITGAKFSMDTFITGASFTPWVGPWIGAQYFVIDNTIGVEEFNNIMINSANERINQINKGNKAMIFYPRFGQSVR